MCCRNNNTCNRCNNNCGCNNNNNCGCGCSNPFVNYSGCCNRTFVDNGTTL